MKLFTDTIVGISTAQSQGAISIIRLSGDDSIEIVNKVFKGKNLNKVSSHTVHYGFIKDPKTNQVIDEVLVSVFLAPRTYTTENVVEINCHGGLFVTNQIYELLLTMGARAADAGEFTKRAFLSGRIDLTKAEAVMDVIDAENKAALKIANSALLGKISGFVNEKRQDLLDIIATISVNIDYPEYDDVEELTNNDILPRLLKVYNELTITLENAKSAKLLKNGIQTAIVGRPNVGKSSLLNAILKENKAIVTNIPGTTRDIVESSVQLKNVTLNLIDTAGIRETDDIVEKIGVERSMNAITKADLILFVIDGSNELTSEDLEIYNSVKDKVHLVVINKSDLEQKLDTNYFKEYISISTKEEESIEKLETEIINKLNLHNIANKDITYISNARQIEKLQKAINALDDAFGIINSGCEIDFVDIEIRKAWLFLGEIIGETSTDSLLDELFSKFCLGK